MSLVAYDASSDEGSDNEEIQEPIKPATTISAPSTKSDQLKSIADGHISDDEDDDFIAETESLPQKHISLLLPKPKNIETDATDTDNITKKLAKLLPIPKSVTSARDVIVEEDDEFLHKKANPALCVEHTKPTKVQIKIPSLKDFSDVDKDMKNSKSTNATTMQSSKGSGLLSQLPKAKSEQIFAKPKEDHINTININATITNKTPAFIPDAVKLRRPAQNTEAIDGITVSSKKTDKNAIKSKASALVECSESDASDDDDDDDDADDFFSLNVEEKLPEVNSNDINAMVAKHAAKMTEAKNKFLNMEKEQTEKQLIEENDVEMHEARKRYHEKNLDTEAMQALLGSRAKRRRKQENNIEVIDVSSNQVLPDRDEWMRTALTSSTSYQPTGVLNDDEPASGTRKKHQITYLAHKAKSNEAELQAMWAANRATRRATQSKYGF